MFLGLAAVGFLPAAAQAQAGSRALQARVVVVRPEAGAGQLAVARSLALSASARRVEAGLATVISSRRAAAPAPGDRPRVITIQFLRN
ncbi:MAG: hypothetical protein AB7L66_08445 [Gemmatimonadales bacterium]